MGLVNILALPLYLVAELLMRLYPDSAIFIVIPFLFLLFFHVLQVEHQLTLDLLRLPYYVFLQAFVAAVVHL